MQQLTHDGQKIVNDLAQRYGFSPDAVTHMLFAVLNGNGSMAQFNHPEFAGSGQWMQGGMLMLGDMFNHALKGRVDALCWEISGILANQPGLLRSGSFQSQSQSGGGQQSQGAGVPMGESSLFVPDRAAHWWPRDLGTPSATGSQNNVRYAYFANAHRLAVETNGQVWVYDTLDHQIGELGEDHAVLERSGLPLVGIADHEFVFAFGSAGELPFHPGREPRSSSASQSGRLDTPDDFSGAQGYRLGERLAWGELGKNHRSVESQVVLDHGPH